MRSDLGARLRQIRASSNQQEMADVMGVAKRTYASYERSERVPDALMLVPLVERGWNGNWLLTGEGPERLEGLQGKGSEGDAPQSHDLDQERLILALQLVEDALASKNAYLATPKRAEATMLVYELLGSGLPEADVIPITRRAVGLAEGGAVDGNRGKAAVGR